MQGVLAAQQLLGQGMIEDSFVEDARGRVLSFLRR